MAHYGGKKGGGMKYGNKQGGSPRNLQQNPPSYGRNKGSAKAPAKSGSNRGGGGRSKRHTLDYGN